MSENEATKSGDEEVAGMSLTTTSESPSALDRAERITPQEMEPSNLSLNDPAVIGAIRPRFKYNRERLLEISELPLSKVRPSFLDKFSQLCAKTQDDEGRDRVDRDLHGDKYNKRRNNQDPRERLRKEDSIRLSPQRRSFTLGCSAPPTPFGAANVTNAAGVVVSQGRSEAAVDLISTSGSKDRDVSGGLHRNELHHRNDHFRNASGESNNGGMNHHQARRVGSGRIVSYEYVDRGGNWEFNGKNGRGDSEFFRRGDVGSNRGNDVDQRCVRNDLDGKNGRESDSRVRSIVDTRESSARDPSTRVKREEREYYEPPTRRFGGNPGGNNGRDYDQYYDRVGKDGVMSRHAMNATGNSRNGGMTGRYNANTNYHDSRRRYDGRTEEEPEWLSGSHADGAMETYEEMIEKTSSFNTSRKGGITNNGQKVRNVAWDAMKLQYAIKNQPNLEEKSHDDRDKSKSNESKTNPKNHSNYVAGSFENAIIESKPEARSTPFQSFDEDKNNGKTEEIQDKQKSEPNNNQKSNENTHLTDAKNVELNDNFLEDLLKLDQYCDILPNGIDTTQPNTTTAGSKFKRWFQTRDSPKEESHTSRRSSLHEDIVINVLKDLNLSNSNTFFAPISPVENNGSEIDQRSNAQPIRSGSVRNDKEKGMGGKLMSLEELESEIRQKISISNEEDKTAFKKFIEQVKTGHAVSATDGLSNKTLQPPLSLMQMLNKSHETDLSRGTNTAANVNPQSFNLTSLPGLQDTIGRNQMQSQPPPQVSNEFLDKFHQQQQLSQIQQKLEMINKLNVQQQHSSRAFQPSPLPHGFSNDPMFLSSHQNLSTVNLPPMNFELLQRPEAQVIMQGLKCGDITVQHLYGQLNNNYSQSPRQRETISCVLKWYAMQQARLHPQTLINGQQRVFSPTNPMMSHSMTVPPPNVGASVPPAGAFANANDLQQFMFQQQQPRVSPLPQNSINPGQQRIPSPRQLQAHTQSIMQQALIKKKLEEQRENYLKKQQQLHATSPTIINGTSANSGTSATTHTSTTAVVSNPITRMTSATSPVTASSNKGVSSPTPHAFTPTSVLRKMTANKDMDNMAGQAAKDKPLVSAAQSSSNQSGFEQVQDDESNQLKSSLATMPTNINNVLGLPPTNTGNSNVAQTGQMPPAEQMLGINFSQKSLGNKLPIKHLSTLTPVSRFGNTGIQQPQPPVPTNCNLAAWNAAHLAHMQATNKGRPILKGSTNYPSQFAAAANMHIPGNVDYAQAATRVDTETNDLMRARLQQTSSVDSLEFRARLQQAGNCYDPENVELRARLQQMSLAAQQQRLKSTQHSTSINSNQLSAMAAAIAAYQNTKPTSAPAKNTSGGGSSAQLMAQFVAAQQAHFQRSGIINPQVATPSSNAQPMLHMQHMQRPQGPHGHFGNNRNMPINSMRANQFPHSGEFNIDVNTSNNMNYQSNINQPTTMPSGELSPTSNQLARWFSPKLLAQARAGQLPDMSTVTMAQNAKSLEELERMQQASAAVHN